MNRKRSYILFFIVMVIVILAGCAKSAPSIVGRWQSTITEEITVEFNSNGTVTEYWEDSVTNDESTYSMDGDKVSINQNGDIFVVDLIGDELVYMDETIYTRIP